MNFVDMIAPAERAVLKMFGRPAMYAAGPAAPVQLVAYIRGLRSEDLFAGAQQQDVVAVVDASQFVIVTGADMPRRYDRLRVGAISYSVEQWRGSPNDAAPVFYKLLLRGGAQ